MHDVALFLQKNAIKRRSKAAEFDQFGRSAFNRYYYALFLEVRSFIREFDPERNLIHSQIHLELKGSIKREIEKRRKKAVANKENDIVALCGRAETALYALASLLIEANKTRVKADYHPEDSISDLGKNRFSLDAVSITDAHGWLAEARRQIPLIRRAWRMARAGA